MSFATNNEHAVAALSAADLALACGELEEAEAQCRRALVFLAAMREEGLASGVPVDGDAQPASPTSRDADPDGDVVATPDATIPGPCVSCGLPCVICDGLPSHLLCCPMCSHPTSHPTHLSAAGPTPTHGAGGGRGALDARHLHPSNHKPGA